MKKVQDSISLSKQLPFTTFINDHLRCEYLSPAQKITFIVLYSYADSTGKAWPSQHRISRETGQSRKSVQRAVADLVLLGLLSKKSRGAGKGWNYILNIEWFDSTPTMKAKSSFYKKKYNDIALKVIEGGADIVSKIYEDADIGTEKEEEVNKMLFPITDVEQLCNDGS